MNALVRSVVNVRIRLTDERWAHIGEEHAELGGRRDDVLEAVARPDVVLAGNEGALLAVREIEARKWLVVVYREEVDDGFIITAFLTRRDRSLFRRRRLWPPLTSPTT